MATNKVRGLIIHKESGLGIPGLVVEVLDIDPRAFNLNPDEDNIYVTPGRPLQDEKFEAGIDPDTGPQTQGLPADRLGSVATDGNGYFELIYEDEAFKISQRYRATGPPTPELRPDLFLVVTVPEESGTTLFDNVIYRSNWARVNAGRDEQYLIKITTLELEKFKVPIPVPQEEPDEPAAIETKRKGYADKVNQVYQAKYQAELVKVKDFEVAFRSSVSKAKAGDEYLKDDDDIEEKQKQIFGEGIQEINQQPVNAEGVIFLTAAKKETLAPYLSPDGSRFANVPAFLIDPILHPNADDKKKPTFLLRNNPVAEFCRKKTTEEICAKEHLEEPPGNGGEENGQPDGEQNGSLTMADIPRYLNNLIRFQSSPEERVYFGEAVTSRRPTQQDVQNSINSFVLEKGPADAVAYYDFHSLQMAFKNIWMEAIDEGVLDLANSVYSELVTLTGIPVELSKKNPAATLQYAFATLLNGIKADPPAVVVAHFAITQEQWNHLPQTMQTKLTEIAGSLNRLSNSSRNVRSNEKRIFRLEQQGRRIINFVEGESFRSLHKILQELQKRLTENYAFTVFPVKKDGRRSINFGILVTYRQKWEPLNYQAGELVKTITLAPKEERKFSYKTVVKRKRSEKEAEKHSSAVHEEMNTTSRSEAEIVRKAMIKTLFNTTADASFNAGVWSGKFTASLTRDAQNESQETKKDFQEAVHKASQEYKSERSTEIDTEEVYESEVTQSTTIANPNDELAVTYLFYELQRRYRVSQEIHRLTPVIYVAQEVPAPQDITEHWLIAHDWILRRVILDDSFIAALNYLSTNIVGDEYALRELKKNLDMQRLLLEELKQEALELQEQAGRRYQALEQAIATRISVEESEESEGWLTSLDDILRGDNTNPEAAKAREQAAQDAQERAMQQAKEKAAQLQREVTALNALTEKYTKELSRHLNRKTQIERLQVHVKDNIFYYMQAIWSHEPPDQRFFRLATKVRVPHFEAKFYNTETGIEVAEKFYTIETGIAENVWVDPLGNKTAHYFDLNTNMETELTYKELIEVADVDNLLGFKGNYAIFPLKVPNALTDFMMAPYVDAAFGLRDPDEFGNMNLQDFSKYICCLHDEMTPEQYEAIKPALKEYYKYLLTSPLRNGEDIIVPANGSLFIEALPASHPLLEDFKLMHRAIDVKKVQAEVRGMELENVRYAARLLSDEREDPRIEKKIVVEGNGVQANLDVENG